MSLTTATAPPPAGPESRHRPARRSRLEPPNRWAGLLTLGWLVVVAVPLLVMISWALQSRDAYLAEGPLAPPRAITADNLVTVFDSGFLQFFLNTAVVTVACVGLTLIVSVPAAYAIVRSPSRIVALGFRGFLLGLAIPAQATIIPIYLMIVRMGLYDTLGAIILPTTAFSLPLAVLVLASALRDVPREQYEAMTLDGASAWRMMFSLVVPMSLGSVITVGVYTALTAWNGFLFPLILTQSEDQRVLTLGLWSFQSEFGVNVPGLMTAVLLSALPVFVAYLFARRWLIAGLAGMGGK
ncbi:carbohydrate ABC transporter permease [Actinoalloteichus sp. GBA129-24]|uniref:carbohydrate ABC transporter permease n=1 Tax=Actinoalloteichus sp. GBA129-24 TaxID=1612551 RepID=UPI0009505ADA|nr:carbohydrate ABC transporter permease [Actinoalloteichus sp. GBA129-24]APU21860.1 ABC-type sugar transport system, permease component [Actinoalloteichus sp. GBA129-24]